MSKAPLMQIVLRAGTLFIHNPHTRTEPVQPEFFRCRMGPILRHQMRETMARRGHRFEPAVTPAAINIEPVNPGLVDNR